jgi:tRNA G18 (ribose-2'-O)-methylase SpoU
MQSLNFQQKIAPAKAQFLEDAAEDAPSAASGGVDDPSAAPALRLASCKHLVVCASLVSNPVNLGGLCRTAEIMQATLLLGDARLLHDASFVGVSSTANLWADIEIVPKDALVAHLLAMRARGYAIVGLEQTVHSTPLQRTRFPDWVVLVLGDEKRGIPSAILNVLTHCVEIPQFGLIRSLNVHVSAGMLVWEYVKQALIEQEDAQNATAAGSTGAGVVLRQP